MSDRTPNCGKALASEELSDQALDGYRDQDRCLPKFTNPAKLPQLGLNAIARNLRQSHDPITIRDFPI